MRRLYRLGLIIVLAAAVIALAVSRGGQAAWFLVWLLTGVSATSGAVTMFNLMKAGIRRNLEAPVLAYGEALHVELEIRHRSLFPVLWLSVSDRFVRMADKEVFTVTKLIYPGFSRSLRVSYRMWGLERGEYRFTGTELQTGDWWGLAVKRRLLPASGDFAILPEARTVLPSLLPPGRGEEAPVGLLRYGTATTAYTVREYAPGDPLHRIHWRSTARLGELMTRPMEPAEELKLMICLNGTIGAGGEKASFSQRFEQGIGWAAGMLQAAADNRLSAGFACTSRGEPWLPPQSKPEYRGMLRLLAGLSPDGTQPFSWLLQRVCGQVSTAYAVIVIAPPPGEDDIGALGRLQESKRQVLYYYLLGDASPTRQDQDLKRKLELAGCRVTFVREARTEGTVRLDARYEGA